LGERLLGVRSVAVHDPGDVATEGARKAGGRAADATQGPEVVVIQGGCPDREPREPRRRVRHRSFTDL
jgi:hypothetical protein